MLISFMKSFSYYALASNRPIQILDVGRLETHRMDKPSHFIGYNEASKQAYLSVAQRLIPLSEDKLQGYLSKGLIKPVNKPEILYTFNDEIPINSYLKTGKGFQLCLMLNTEKVAVALDADMVYPPTIDENTLSLCVSSGKVTCQLNGYKPGFPASKLCTKLTPLSGFYKQPKLKKPLVIKGGVPERYLVTENFDLYGLEEGDILTVGEGYRIQDPDRPVMITVRPVWVNDSNSYNTFDDQDWSRVHKVKIKG